MSQAVPASSQVFASAIWLALVQGLIDAGMPTDELTLPIAKTLGKDISMSSLLVPLTKRDATITVPKSVYWIHGILRSTGRYGSPRASGESHRAGRSEPRRQRARPGKGLRHRRSDDPIFKRIFGKVGGKIMPVYGHASARLEGDSLGVKLVQFRWTVCLCARTAPGQLSRVLLTRTFTLLFQIDVASAGQVSLKSLTAVVNCRLG
jgi:hypothetical protein